MANHDTIIESLTVAAERGGDIAPAIFEAWYAMSPAARDLMSHIDELARGKMMDEVYRLLMVEDYADEDNYLSFEMKTHEQSYSVGRAMYAEMLKIVHDCVREAAGDAWTSEFEDAWLKRCEKLLEALAAHFPVKDAAAS